MNRATSFEDSIKNTGNGTAPNGAKYQVYIAFGSRFAVMRSTAEGAMVYGYFSNRNDAENWTIKDGDKPT